MRAESSRIKDALGDQIVPDHLRSGQANQAGFIQNRNDDHGTTWKRGEIATENTSDECEVVETADGSLYMNARSRHNKHRRDELECSRPA